MNPKISSWKNKRVWIIGASSGIGAELALQLLAHGARVALSARNQSALTQLAQSYDAAVVLPLDVTQADQVQAASDQLQQQWQGIDLVCVVAGVYNEMRADTFNLDVANALIDVNLRGVFNCLAATLPTLLKQKMAASQLCLPLLV